MITLTMNPKLRTESLRQKRYNTRMKSSLLLPIWLLLSREVTSWTTNNVLMTRLNRVCGTRSFYARRVCLGNDGCDENDRWDESKDDLPLRRSSTSSPSSRRSWL